MADIVLKTALKFYHLHMKYHFDYFLFWTKINESVRCTTVHVTKSCMQYIQIMFLLGNVIEHTCSQYALFVD